MSCKRVSVTRAQAVLGCIAEMRREHDVIELEERMFLADRFDVVDVDRVHLAMHRALSGGDQRHRPTIDGRDVLMR